MAKLDVMLTAFDGGTAWWVLPTSGMAQEVWASLRHALLPFDPQINKAEKIISFDNGGEIAIKSGFEPDYLRGSSLDSVVIDEAAFCHPEVWQALRPALSDRSGKALLLSTPRGHNWFWELYMKGLDPLEPDWVSWRMPTAANPFIPKSEISAARHDLPERIFAQEYEAAFLEDYGTVFRGVRECVIPMPIEVNEPVCFGVDWGRHNDYTVITVLGMQSKRMYWLERFNQMTWKSQRLKLQKLAKRWQPKIILAEANSIGEPNIELW